MSESREQSIRKQLSKLGEELPDIITNSPKLIRDEPFLWRCYWELDTERYPSSHSFMPIPINAIAQYAKWNFIPEKYFERYSYCIRQLDMHYVSVANGEIASARRKK